MNIKGVIVVEDPGGQAPGCRGRRPSALEQVANRPIVHHVIEALESAGVAEVLVVSSADCADQVRDVLAGHGEHQRALLRYAQTPGRLDLAGAFRAAAPMIGAAPCVVHLAGGLLDEPLAPFVERMRVDSPDVALILQQPPAVDKHLKLATEDILHNAKLAPEHGAHRMAGVGFFGPEALRRVGQMAWEADGEVNLTLAAAKLAAQGRSFEVLHVAGWRAYAGDPLDLLELNRVALDRLEGDRHGESGDGNRIEGRVTIHERASVRTSVIVGPTVIGAGARIADAYIGPYTSIGDRARIEGAEIERSIISTGASIIHVGGRIVSSVVGRDARVFRDFSLPRALRLHVGDGTEVALC